MAGNKSNDCPQATRAELVRRSFAAILRCLILCSLSVILIATLVEAQQAAHHPHAPTLAVDLLQAPKGAQASWPSLRGRAVVLYFWATWCTGCVAEIPHLNAITEKFKDRPVTFIFVTDEEQDTVSRFIAQRPISGWVALDRRDTTFRSFGVVGRPMTAFIDAAGALCGKTSVEVTESEIGDLLAGTMRMTQSPEADIPTVGAEAKAPLPLLDVLIRPAMPVAESGMSPGAKRQRGNLWEAWGLSLREILSYAFSISPERIMVPASSDARYDIAVTLPDSTEEGRRAILRKAAESAFRVTAQILAQQTDVFVLRRRGAASLPLREHESGRSVDVIINLAERTLKRPVVDETGLHEKYDFVLAFPHNADELADSIRSLGLELVPEHRSIDVLVVKPTTPAESESIP
jgi:thiol-disulfide isomerase/thioredoxin